jgi:hypothetical protein
MFNKIFCKPNFFYQQDTIRVSSNNQDSSVIKPAVSQTIDSAKQTSSEINDTSAAIKIVDTIKEKILLTDSSKASLKKTLISTQESGLTQKMTQANAAKKQVKLSFNTPEDFAKLIYTDVSKPAAKYTSFERDTLTTFTEIQQKESTFFKRLQTNTDWIFCTYVIIALLFLWIQVFYRKYFTSLFNSGISYHMSSKLFNERNILARRVSIVLNFIYTVSVSLVIFKIIQYLGVKSDTFDKFSLFLIILNLVILYSISKAVVQKIIGFIFYKLDQINEYLHNVYVYNKILGIFLLPLSFAAFYTPNKITEILLIAAIVFYVLSLVFKIIRGFQIIINNDVFIFYSILYLCTLEILHVIIGYKIFKTLA